MKTLMLVISIIIKVAFTSDQIRPNFMFDHILLTRFHLFFSIKIIISVRTALLAIIGFMPTHGAGALGSLDYSPDERKILAKRWVFLKYKNAC